MDSRRRVRQRFPPFHTPRRAVFIPFSRYVAGGAREFDGRDLVNDSDGKVIAVLIQYRLGVFGACLIIPR